MAVGRLKKWGLVLPPTSLHVTNRARVPEKSRFFM